MLEFLFNKVAGLKVCNFNKMRLQRSCFPVNNAKDLRTPILKNIWKRLLLKKKSFTNYYKKKRLQERMIKGPIYIGQLLIGQLFDNYLTVMIGQLFSKKATKQKINKKKKSVELNFR